jgi:hypothetical protein
MDTLDPNLLEQKVLGWPEVGPIITDSVPVPSESMKFLTPKEVGQELLSSLKTYTTLDSLRISNPEVEELKTARGWIDTVYGAVGRAPSNQSDTPLSMSEPINPPIVEATVTPAPPEPANLTPAEQRKAELEARRAAVKAEAKALVAEERALARHTKQLNRAKVKALIETQKEELKRTSKMLLEIATMMRDRSYYGLKKIEIPFSIYDQYFEVTDIGIEQRGSNPISRAEIVETNFEYYYNSAPPTFIFKQSGIFTFDLFLQLIEEHVSAYIPADLKVTDGLLVIKPTGPIKERVLVYLKEEKVEPLYTTASTDE